MFYPPDERVCILLTHIAATNRSESLSYWPWDLSCKQLSASHKIYEHVFQRLFAVIAHRAVYYQAWVFPWGSAGALCAPQRLVLCSSSSSPPVVSSPDIWPVQIKQRDQRLFPPVASWLTIGLISEWSNSPARTEKVQEQGTLKKKKVDWESFGRWCNRATIGTMVSVFSVLIEKDNYRKWFVLCKMIH